MWSTDARPVQVCDFSGQAGPNVPLSAYCLDVFSLYFDDEVMDLVVAETNLYADQVRSSKNLRKVWTTNREEIRAYFGFMILMGINKLPEIRDYWSTHPYLHYAPVADRISRDRFEEITRYLHFADNTVLPARGEPGFSRLQKVQPILTAIKERLRSVYSPHCQLSVDEAMVPFKGRSSMKQYMPMKPVKRGFKMWVLADALNGYFCDVDPYVGACGDSSASSGLGLGERVVLKLVGPVQDKHHQVYCDNYFTSVPLFSTLLDRGTYACGTIRSNRKYFPKEMLVGVKSLSRGDHVFRQCGNLVATVWKDSKPVTLMSTSCQPTATTTANRRQKDGSKLVVSCPECVSEYNRFMAGVDKGDQLRGYYVVRLKSMKYYRYIFWFLFDVCVTNTYVLMRYQPTTAVPQSQQNLKNFRLRLAHQLIGTYQSRKRAGRPRKSATCVRSTIELLHMPSHSPSQRCIYCQQHRAPPRRKESVWQCHGCDGYPTLCLTGRDDGSDCFRLWHNAP